MKQFRITSLANGISLETEAPTAKAAVIQHANQTHSGKCLHWSVEPVRGDPDAYILSIFTEKSGKYPYRQWLKVEEIEPSSDEEYEAYKNAFRMCQSEPV